MKNLATFLALTAFVAYSEARGGVDDEYVSYIAKYGKQPTSTREQLRRQVNFRNAQTSIDEINRKVAASGRGATAKLNFLADLDADEKANYMGRKSSGTVNRLPMYDNLNSNLGHDMDIDHKADGRMHDVKNQGSCGSCWAFGALTSLEGALAVKDNTTNPRRLSEQEGVDCTNYQTTTKFGKNYGNYGCGGGLEYNHWDFAIDHGIMYDEDYPYTARDDACDRELVDSRATMTRVTSWQRETRSVAAIAERLHSTPIAIGVYAGCNAFMYYEGGIITQEQCPQDGMDHSVVIIGYTAGGDGDGDDGSDGDDGDDGDNSNLNCTQTKWWYTCEQAPQRSSGTGYWTIQNSWGTGWGEQGYGKLELAEGTGVACSNCDATSPNLD